VFAIEKFMKFRFANGHSINLWDTEYDRITVSEGKITYVRPGGKVVVIEVPKEWFEGSWSRPEALSLTNCSVEAASMGNGKIWVQGAREPDGKASVSAQCGTERKFENTEKVNVPFVKLTNQVEALRQDLTQFSGETKKKMESLFKLPARLDACEGLLDETSFEVNRISRQVDEVQDKVCMLLEEEMGEEGLYIPIKCDKKKSCGPQRKGQYR